MDAARKKELKAAYANRHPEMGVVAWCAGDRMWIARSKDVRADYNGTSFQLDLGSWPERDLQRAYKAAPESFEWRVLRTLEYEDPSDVDDDLELLLMECMDEYPDAKPMRPGRR